MIYIASLLAAIIPMVLYLILIWRFDIYDREPFSLVLRNYLWGAVGAVIFSIIISGSLSKFLFLIIKDESILDNIETFFIAPFVEEIMKGLFLLFTVMNRKFDNITDGIVYGGAIGLGFGMTENFLYFISYGNSIEQWVMVVIIRTLFSGVMHCLATATFGAFLGYAKFKGLLSKIFLPLIGLALAMFLHFAWNFTVSNELTGVIGFLLIFASVIMFIIVFSLSIIREKKIIYNELYDEVKSGLIPFEHLSIINSPKRNKQGWIDENIRKLYIKAVTTLAFRKLQFRNSNGANKDFYKQDIEYYRNYLQNLYTKNLKL
jgi:RsiW-degrading membrane proteinase PrsW (M82 family)